MNKVFSDIVTNVGNDVFDTSAAFKTIIKTYCNNRYFTVLRAINFEVIREDYTFDTTSGTQDYTLPDDFGKPLTLRDTTNGAELAETDLQQLYKTYPDSVTDSGTIERYFIYEDRVKDQPSSASVLTCVSSSASDTTQSIVIRGITSNGDEAVESVSLNGTNDVTSTAQFTRVKGISKSAVTTGYVTIDSNTAAKTQAIMSPNVTTAYYKKIKFHYKPNATITIACPYFIKPLPMVNDSDYPIIDIADLIELGAKADAQRYKRQFAKAAALEGLFAIELQRYIFDQENKPNMVQQFAPDVYNKDNLY